ncbi:MAG: electron transfer flavoprotein subunit alpha/FixB family protein, partial [Bacteroidia bacterium]
MSVLLFAEHSEGSFKKATFEAASYAYDLAQKLGGELQAVSVGQISDEELGKLGQYGVGKVYKVSDESLNAFANTAYAAAIAAVAKETGARAVVFSQTYNGRAISPRLAVKLKAAPLSGVTTMVDPAN